MNWFGYSLAGAFLTAAYQLVSRALLKDKGDSLAFTFITTVFGALVLFIFLPFEKPSFPITPVFLLVFLFLGLIYAWDDWLFIRARQLEEASKIAIALQSNLFWSLWGGLLIFGEKITAVKLAGVALIVLASITVIWQGRKLRPSPGFLLGLLAVFVFVAYSLVDKFLLGRFSPNLYKIALLAIESAWLFLAMGGQSVTRTISEVKLQGWTIVIVGPLLSIALFFVARAFQAGGEASRVLPIVSLSTILVILGAALFLGERENLTKKTLAALAAFFGAYLIYVF